LSEPLLEVSALRCERDDRVLFEALSFTLEGGRALQLRGPNGAGKTTLLRCIAGLHPDYDGEVRLQGTALRALDSAGAHLLFVGHRPGVSAALTAADNLRWHLEIGGACADAAAVAASLERVGLAGWDDVPCQQMSAGQQRRVALARLALVGPGMPLWLLDEPFTALDDRGIELILELMGERLASGGAVLFTTHQPVTALPSLTTLWIGAPGAGTDAMATA
jgi:heme exporter protein A